MSMILMPSYGLMESSRVGLRYSLALQRLRAGRCLELAGVDRHRQHAVVADRAGELDEAVVAESSDQRLHRGLVDPVLAHELACELDDLRILGRDAAAVILADGGDRRFRDVEPPGAAGLRAPDVRGLELARDGHRG